MTRQLFAPQPSSPRQLYEVREAWIVNLHSFTEVFLM